MQLNTHIPESRQAEFMAAYTACHERFVRYCSVLAYGKMETEDLIQDVLLSAYVHYDQIREKGELLHYLIRAARNRSVSIWRRKKFQAENLDNYTETFLAKGVSPETLLDIQLLYRMLDKLPEKQRNALLLFEISGFSMQEIASIQNSTEGAVKTKISRGRKKLAELMDDSSGGSSLTLLLRSAQILFL